MENDEIAAQVRDNYDKETKRIDFSMSHVTNMLGFAFGI